ncbi:hypothetical protein BH11MYX3_BH11MYX3_06850 [soil metagenome]
MELCELLPETDGDPVREREVEATRRLWAAGHPEQSGPYLASLIANR